MVGASALIRRWRVRRGKAEVRRDGCAVFHVFDSEVTASNRRHLKAGSYKKPSEATTEQRQQLNKKSAARRRRQREKRRGVTAVEQASAAFQAAERKSRSKTTQAAVDNMLSAAQALEILKRRDVIRANFPVQDVLNGDSFFTSPAHMREGSGGPSFVEGREEPPALHPECNKMVRDLVEDGWTYVENDVE